MTEINPSVRILFYSGNPLGSDIRQLLGSGQHGFIRKPFRPAELACRMAEILSTGDDATSGR